MSETQQPSTQPAPIPSLVRFEQAVAGRQFEAACTELLAILRKLDSSFGQIEGIEFSYPTQLQLLPQEVTVYFCTRMANAITQLFSDKELSLTDSGVQQFLVVQRWINMIFASSPFVNADHILAVYNTNPEPDSLWENVLLDNNPNSLRKFVIMYLPESNVRLNFDLLWQANPTLCASLCFALQSPRFIGTQAAFDKRAFILQWFPDKLASLPNLNNVPSSIAHDVYMHCSYDIAANKHQVKKALNQVIRRHIEQMGWKDRDVSKIGTKNGKPVMLVLLEHFNSSHSIYRTHSTSMVAARNQFHLIGLGSAAVDAVGRAVFDEFIELSSNNVIDRMNDIRTLAEEVQAAVFYMPSIGMDLITIFMSNTRIAPVQAIALGHPATTHSPYIDHVIVEDDYVGNENCFSETLLRLPKDALPYVPSALAPNAVEYKLRENPEVVNIGVASTTMKLNPYFLRACEEIRRRAKVRVHFHFAMGQSNGITHRYVERFLQTYLGSAVTAHPHQSYPNYLRTLYDCDMMINPFPFGNTNGIIDMVTLGLVGVCKTGPEVHEHIDEGLFKRLGLPEWLITNTADEYVECAIRLAENHEERLALRRHIIENNGLKTLFTGDPSPMGRILLAKVHERVGQPAPVEETAQPAPKKRGRKPANATTASQAVSKPATKAVTKEATKAASKTKAAAETKTTTRKTTAKKAAK